MERRVAAAAVVVVAAALLASIFFFRQFGQRPAAERGLVLRPLGPVADLPGWSADDQTGALAAFLRSCRRLDGIKDSAPLDATGREGFGADWHEACGKARSLPLTGAAARAFFEQEFVAVAVQDGDSRDGLFTGYYEPELRGSLTRDARYRVPLLAPPSDLVSVDLGAFAPDLKGRRIAGRVAGNRLEPYADRAAIESGALGRKARPILWVDDPIQAFFLHIQGSGRILLANGAVVRVGYAAQNGHPYVPIGRVLVERGALTREEVSLQTIRAWLAAHPAEARGVMDANPSYVFFRVLDASDPALGPPGSQQVPLTPGRSLAVDRAFHGLGVPIWLDTSLPDPKPGSPDRPLQRLMVAQDTGGAIKGPVRGDVFWGFGPEAEAVAGRMKSRGRMALLLPRAAAARLSAPESGERLARGPR